MHDIKKIVFRTAIIIIIFAIDNSIVLLNADDNGQDQMAEISRLFATCPCVCMIYRYTNHADIS